MIAPELSLFLALLRAGMLGEKPDLSVLDGKWDEIRPEGVKLLAKRHDVVLPVYAALEGAEEPKLQRLKQILHKNYAPRFAKSVNQDCEGTALLAALEQAGIDCIPLKGWVMRRYYADPLNRSMNDLDILVRGYDHRQMMKLMKGLGYQGESLSAWKHENYEKKPFMNVELHRRLTDDSGYIRSWEEKMWSRSRLEEGYDHVRRMSEEDFYLHHLLHMEEDFRHGTLGFRRIADTWLLRERCPEMDRDYLEGELRAMGIETFARRMEQLSRVCFYGEEPDADCAVLLRYAQQNSVTGSENSYQLGRMASMSRGGLRQARLKSLWNAVFLPFERMKAQFPVLEKHPVLLPFCWAWRLFRLALHPRRNLKKMKGDGVSQKGLEQMRRVFRAGGIQPEDEN